MDLYYNKPAKPERVQFECTVKFEYGGYAGDELSLEHDIRQIIRGWPPTVVDSVVVIVQPKGLPRN